MGAPAVVENRQASVESAPLAPAGLGGRIPALDGLRGIAILLVLLWHLVFNGHRQSNLLPGFFSLGAFTWSGVDLFFVLSGFLIGGILLDAKNSPRYFQTFYLRRAFRILPLYGVIAGIYVLYHLFLGGVNRIPLISYVTFTQNFWMAYLGVWGTAGMRVTWSLAVEEQFYLTIPLVVRKLKRSRLMWVLAFVIIGAPVLRTWMLLSFEHGRFAAYVLMPCRADALCLGVLMALLVREPRAWGWMVANKIWLRSIAAALFAGLAGLALQNYDQTATPMVTFGYSLLALFYGCCLLLALMEVGLGHRILCNRRLMGLGIVAYCVYLVHVPFIEAGRGLVVNYFPALGRLAVPHVSAIVELAGDLLGVILTLFIAKLSWHFFEQPLLRKGRAYKF